MRSNSTPPPDAFGLVSPAPPFLIWRHLANWGWRAEAGANTYGEAVKLRRELGASAVIRQRREGPPDDPAGASRCG
jgi:hypothetical protein